MKTVLVTVGTTKFDELIQAVDSQAFLDAVKSQGYKQLLVQRGNGYTPQLLTKASAGLAIECFDYKPTLAADYGAADLVISHAGSGSIFEGLSSSKPMIVVPNSRLMANHQVELAAQLERMQHLVYATPETLAEVLGRLDVSKLKPYAKGSAQLVAQHITGELLGLVGAGATVAPTAAAATS